MAQQANAVVEMDHKGRLTVPEPSRKVLGVNDIEEGEKELVKLTIETPDDGS